MDLEEPWEAALDLDDSDLPSLLRPCKRRRSASDIPLPLLNQPAHLPSSSRRPPIPGPAAAVHAAMLRKDLDRANHNFSHDHGKRNDVILSTQDYIRKAMDDTAEFDDDFSRRPWVSALQFLGAEDDLIPSTPISSIKKCVNGDKVAQVVAVVKSCNPNGLGGLLVSLKDPTGTIGASIHHKVLSQSEFGKELTTGAVLILQRVAVFAPVRSAHYLNVTMRNMVKVFCLNKSSTSELCTSVHPVQYADPDIESCRNARAVEKTSSVQIMMDEDTETRHCARTENSPKENVIQRKNLFAMSTQSSNKDKRGYINLTQSQHAYKRKPEDLIRATITDDDQEILNGTKRGTKEGNIEGSLVMDSDDTTSHHAETNESRGTNEVQTQRQPLLSTTTLPQWTDEQLDELFAGDEDDSSLF